MALTQEEQKELNNNLIDAIYKNDLNQVKLLHQNGADLNYIYGFNMNPIATASMKGYLDIVKYLHKNGSEYEYVINGDKCSAITLACAKGHLEVVKYLFENRASINWDNKTIIAATRNNHFDILKYFYIKGVSLETVISDFRNNEKDSIREELIAYKEKLLLESDLKNIKLETKTTSRRI